MPLAKDMVIARLRNALQAAVKEVRTDADFAPKVLNTVCTELGMDSMAALYFSGKLRQIILDKARNVS
jgi:hypothetical protein